MTNASPCPDAAALEHFLLGTTSEPESDKIERHLLSCDRCCQTLRSVQTDDGLAVALKGDSRLDAISEEPAVQAAMSQIKALRPQAGVALVDETITAAGDHTDDAWGLNELLDPPRAEGELGWFGGYRVLRVLGAGGMGLVFEAEDPRLRRRVALKVMKPSLAARDEHHQRFLREARAAAAIEHPHIVTVYQVGEHRGLPFLAMQSLKGEALDDRLRRQPRLPLDECLRIGRETAEALAEAHGRNLIHRDIKPGNIWLEGASGWVKLVDFGLAHAAEDVHLTQTGAILGTPAYMSPEQARGEAVDGRSDLYSLGAVLYKLTTGEVPFRGPNTMAVLTALATETPRRPSGINSDVPPALDDLIVRLLAKKPNQRFQSAQAVAEAIRTIEQENHAHEDKGPKPDEGTRRRHRRWPLVAAGAAFLFLAAIVVIVRDKQGNEAARLQVPDGGSVTVTEDKTSTGGVAATKKVAPALRDGNAAMAVGSLPPSVGATLPEPPSLEEWLKGREVLTVAQDGNGQFKTIQAALDALKPHQVVKVLDGGPYREFIHTAGLPADVGLVSDRQTVIEAPDWQEPDGKRREWGHDFGPLNGFRLSGLRFVAPPTPPPGTWYAILHWIAPSGLVVEDCCFGWTAVPDPNANVVAMALPLETADSAFGPIVVRDCVFDGACLDTGGTTTLVVERNYFRETFIALATRLDDAVIRHNIFDGPKGGFWCQALKEIGGVLEISNNTVSGGVSLALGAPVRGVVLRNNINGRGVAFDGEAFKLRAEVAKNWQRDHNSHLRQQWLSKSPTDLTEDPSFLSTNPGDRNYWRIPADGPLAHGGAGGNWPSYIGALSPGPAPKDGDWFTRLRERWLPEPPANPAITPATISPPLEIAEPPPLEEWLKGRDVLTVAQDGSGQHKTIQAALEALRPGQAVKVLDRGPYREKLNVGELPKNTGLVSERQTVIELPAWDEASAPPGAWEHRFRPINNFRISGLRFVAPPPAPRQPYGAILAIWTASGILVEDCGFAWTTPPEVNPSLPPMALGLVSLDHSPAGDASLVVRNCLFDTGDLTVANEGREGRPVVIERNYFKASKAFVAGPRSRTVVVRHNLFGYPTFDYATAAGVFVFNLTEVDGTLELTNNTTINCGIELAQTAPKRGVVIHNNIMAQGISLGENSSSLLTDAVNNWQFGHNSYSRDGSLPPAPTDVIAPPQFLSTDPAARDFGRIPTDSPLAKAGAGGDRPDYLGALPPGPAPNGGDWFTALQQRWGTAGAPARNGAAE